MAKKKPVMRKLKWVGEPPILMDDHFRVANWTWENARLIALVGHATLRISPDNFPGLSKAYSWGTLPDGNVSTSPWDMIREIDAVDADLIMQYRSDMFVDVTDVDDPLHVYVEPIIVTQNKTTGQFYRSR